MASINPLHIITASALIALIPIAIGLFTSYIKLSVVFGMVKNALGTQQVPGPMVTMALSLGLTVFIMSPVFERMSDIIKTKNLEKLIEKPGLAGLIELAPVIKPWTEFITAHCGKRELAVLSMLPKDERESKDFQQSSSNQNPSFKVVMVAFVLTELKEGFSMAFVLLLPFLVIDLIVANVLAGMGMYMVSPQMISLPLKLLLFVIGDGWLLLAKGLINSYGG